jgi:RNA polymerase sigma-70 factor (ECF subfamily)
MLGSRPSECVLPTDSNGEITRQLLAWTEGNQAALHGAFTGLYESLHGLARRALSRERASHTFGTAGLVGEAFFRMLEQSRTHWRSREHFLAIAAQMMRRILVDYARSRGSFKRGGAAQRVPIMFDIELPAGSTNELIAIHEALEALEALAPTQCKIVELRFFGGLSNDEIARYLGVSIPTVERRWRLARAWLYRELGGSS